MRVAIVGEPGGWHVSRLAGPLTGVGVCQPCGEGGAAVKPMQPAAPRAEERLHHAVATERFPGLGHERYVLHHEGSRRWRWCRRAQA